MKKILLTFVGFTFGAGIMLINSTVGVCVMAILSVINLILDFIVDQ